MRAIIIIIITIIIIAWMTGERPDEEATAETLRRPSEAWRRVGRLSSSHLTGAAGPLVIDDVLIGGEEVVAACPHAKRDADLFPEEEEGLVRVVRHV